MGTRVVRLVSSLIGAHYDLARREAARDQARIVGGALCILLGALFLLMVSLLLHAAAVIQAREMGLSWTYSLLGVALFDLVVGLFFLAIGRSRVRKPVLEETRGLVQKTVTGLTQP